MEITFSCGLLIRSSCGNNFFWGFLVHSVVELKDPRFISNSNEILWILFQCCIQKLIFWQNNLNDTYELTLEGLNVSEKKYSCQNLSGCTVFRKTSNYFFKHFLIFSYRSETPSLFCFIQRLQNIIDAKRISILIKYACHQLEKFYKQRKIN